MSGKRAGDVGVIALVALGGALMALLAAQAAMDSVQDASEDAPPAVLDPDSTPSSQDANAPHVEPRRRRQRRRGEGGPSAEILQPTVHIKRRTVPDLTMEHIRRADLSLREARHYVALGDGRVQCRLCPAVCVLGEGRRGGCGVRINLEGRLRTLVYGRPVAQHVDPIEKKPLFHFLPASKAFSIATAGCNLGCVFCQNWQISQALPESARHLSLTPEEAVARARAAGCTTIAYTYTEPTVFYEYMYDTARLAHEHGLRNLWITCGYINPEPLRELCQVMDAANIDLKGFSEEFYNTYCEASLQPVLDTLRIAKEEGVWVEVTNLVIPGANDDPKMIREMCQWLVETLGPETPLHFSRFHPDYRLLDKPPTPPATLREAAAIARQEGLKHVYIGNLPTERGEDTFCPNCGSALIRRRGFQVTENVIENGRCPSCGADVAGVWK